MKSMVEQPTAVAIAERDAATTRRAVALARIYADLRRCIRIVGITPDDDDEADRFRTEWVSGFTEDDDPGFLMLNGIRESVDLLCHLLPLDQVMIIPRANFDRIAEAAGITPSGVEVVQLFALDILERRAAVLREQRIAREARPATVDGAEGSGG
jgi:hypothetical protein